MSVRARRSWLLTVAAVVAVRGVAALGCGGEGALDELGQNASGLESGYAPLRIVAGNLTSGEGQDYDEGHGIRIFSGLKPDIALVQEFNYRSNSSEDLRAFVNSAFGSGFHYTRESGAQIPNGIVSRYPILDSGEWNDPYVTNRDFSWARIDIPGDVDLWAVSVHLLTSSATSRNNEAKSLVSFIKANVPAGDYVVIGGDFNTTSRSESCLSTLRSVVVTSGPYPADRRGDSDTNAARSRPYDWVTVNAALAGHATSTVIGSSRFANGLVADTRVYSPVSELSPARSTDSGAYSMQHMAVVRDFLIPVWIPPEEPVDGGSDDPSPTPAQVFINEVMVNEPGSDPAGEFVEIVNLGGAAADLSGYTLSDSAGVRHTFAAGTSIAAGSAIVVFGGESAIPDGIPAVAATTGSLHLSNGGDSVTLRDASSAVVSGLSYGSNAASADGVSWNRNPDGTATEAWGAHTSLSASSSSPGTRANGADF